MAISLILADDHAIFLQGLTTLLEADDSLQLKGQGCNGLEAWNLIRSVKPDVAVLDITMPEMSGLEVARRSVATGLDTRIIALTMHEDPTTWLQAREAGIWGYVLKDNSFEELTTAIHRVASGHTFVTPSVQQRLTKLQQQGHSIASLSQREIQVIELIALGNSSKQIARIMDISPRTVDTYRTRIMEKLGLSTVADVVRFAMRSGMVT